jgi:two-component system chemotaxis response regulator CheY
MPESDRQPRVLLVDDDPSVRRLLKRWITQQLKAEVIEATDGLEALVSLRANSDIDLVLTDLSMPIVDGFEMIQVIRADALLTHAEVVIITSVCIESRVREALSLKVSDYILKPLQHEMVIPHIEICLKRSIDNAAKRGSKTASTMGRVLIADNNPKFREAAAIALAGRYTVETARSASDFLIKVHSWDPSLVLLAKTIDGLDASFLAEKASLIAYAGGHDCSIYTLSESAEDDAVKGTLGVIPTGPSIDEFSKAVAAITGGATGLRPEAIRHWVQLLDPELAAGVDATFKSMVGSEPTSVEKFDSEPAFDYFASITIDEADAQFSILVQLQCAKSTANQVVARMTETESAEPASAEDLEAGIGELISIIAGGLKTWCTDHELDVKSSLPSLTEASESRAGGVHYCVRKLTWQDQPFEVSFSVIEGAGQPADAEQQVAEQPSAEASAVETTSII